MTFPSFPGPASSVPGGAAERPGRHSQGSAPAARGPYDLLSVLGARMVVPAAQRELLGILRILAVPAELATVALVVWRIRGAVDSTAAGGDVAERIESAFLAALPNPRLARALAFEFSLIHYALFSRRSRPSGTEGRTISYHRAGGYGGIVFALLLVSACEIIVLHVFVSRLSGVAAWLLTALGLYGVVWILGDYQAVRLRPLTLSSDGLVVQLGLRWSASIPREAIASILPAPRPGRPRRAPGHLHAVPLVPPQWKAALRTPLPVTGPYGITKRVTTVALAADDRDGLHRALIACGLYSEPGPG